MTFLPGDILLTGTPANSRPLEAGDTIDVEVTGVIQFRKLRYLEQYVSALVLVPPEGKPLKDLVKTIVAPADPYVN